jgi:diacylglycerol O-acyltransferase / wax synthase
MIVLSMSRFERLKVLDELFLHLEGPDTHMHVGAVAVLQGPPPAHEELLEMVASRLHLVPRFRQKLALIPFGAGRPVWVDDAHFTIEYHVRHSALPPPGSDEELRRLVARIMSQQLDRSKPLWEIWFAEGLTGNRFALISKAHHCIVDGVAGVDLMSVIFDVGPEPVRVEAETWTPRPEPAPDELLRDALAELMTSPAEIARSVQSVMMDPGALPNKLVAAGRALSAFVGESFSAPPSSLNRPVGPHRRFETVLADLAELKAVKNALGGTVNDVVLTAVAAGLRTLLEGRGESVDGLELRVMVPVSLRPDGERGALGNRVAAMWAALPIHEADPVARYELVRAAMRNLKSSGQTVGAQLLTKLGEYAPPTVLAQAARLIARQRAFNVVVTNVPGPQFPLYTLGREMLEVYPVVPLSNNTSLGIALFSYNGAVCFGLLGDYDVASDLAVLAGGLEKSIAELRHAAG